MGDFAGEEEGDKRAGYNPPPPYERPGTKIGPFTMNPGFAGAANACIGSPSGEMQTPLVSPLDRALSHGMDAAKPKALTYDDGKEPLARLPWAAIDSMSKVQAYGHSKYKDFDNYRKGMEVSRNLSCALRHIRDFLNGADVDHESGLDVLGHAMCRIAFTIQNIKDGVAIDDRFSKRPKT